MSRIFDEDEAIAWPSYVDFLFAFTFILILSLGYMAFLFVHGVEGETFQKEAVSGQPVLTSLQFESSIDWDRHQIVIPMGNKITFPTGCPNDKKKGGCPIDLTSDEKSMLRVLFLKIKKEYPGARVIYLRGQADRDKGPDAFTNFRLGNSRALLVYQYLFGCAQACGLLISNGTIKNVELANSGDTRAIAGGSSQQDRTITVILDYAK